MTNRGERKIERNDSCWNGWLGVPATGKGTTTAHVSTRTRDTGWP